MYSEEDIRMEDLSESQQEIAQIIGIDALLRLCRAMGGTQVYFPKEEELLRGVKYKAIYGEFDGGNIKQLSRKYGVSESTVYKIVRDRIGKVTPQVEGQLSIFDLADSV